MKFKDLLPYFRDDRGAEDAVSARHPSAFGYTYLEKFVQITFRLPRPNTQGIDLFLDSLSGSAEQAVAKEARRRSEQEARARRRKEVAVVAGPDSKEVRKLVELVAPVLDWNPRRIKQFINSFRLHAYIVSDLGLLDLVADDNGQDQAKLTLEQLGKFVAMLLTWPDLVMDLVLYPLMLSAIWRRSHGEEPGISDPKEKLLVSRWGGEKVLRYLMSAGTDGVDGRRYEMHEVDFSALLNISRRMSRRARGTGSRADSTGDGESDERETTRRMRPAYEV